MPEKNTSAREFADNPNRLATDKERELLHHTVVLLAVCHEPDMHSEDDIYNDMYTESGETFTYRKKRHVNNPREDEELIDRTDYSVKYRGPLEEIPNTTKALQRVVEWTVFLDYDAVDFGETYAVIDQYILYDGDSVIEPQDTQLPGTMLSPAEVASFNTLTGFEKGTLGQLTIIQSAARQMIDARRVTP